MIARGLVNIEGCNEIFRKIGEMTLPLPRCKVLIDLADSKCGLQRAEIEAFVNGVEPNRWPHNNKIALVGPFDKEQYGQLQMLADCLSKRGLQMAAFYDSKVAIDWLADKT
jgi:hypothetical protein